MGVYTRPSIVTNGLVLNLDAANIKSYPGSGTTWTDLSGNNNTGTLTNGPTFSRDGGGSIVLDGTNDNIVINNNSTINFTTNFSINCWINIVSLPRTYLGILDKFDGINSNGYAIDIPNGGGGMPTRFRFTVGQGGSFKSVIATSSITLGQWYHVCGIYDGSFIRIFINGILENTTACTGLITVTSENLILGGDNVSTLYANNRYSVLQLHNRALSTSEIQQNYNALKSRFNLS